jgi:peptide/nickel transport system ATP-binding protein
MTAAIEIRDLFRVHTTEHGTAASLQGLSLTVQAGETVVVLGPSGAGKTTLLRMVAGLERPSAGTVRVFGTDIARLSSSALARHRAAGLGYVDQHYTRALAPELSARELVALRLRMQGEPRHSREGRADALLAAVGLSDKADAHPYELSGGEQQRVAVCAALAHRPRLLLADEPTGELDGAAARRLYEVIAELLQGERCTALIVSHDPASTHIADRTIGIRDGRVAEERGRGAADGSVVVGRGGWLRVPEELLASAGIGSLAQAALETRGIVLSAVGPGPVTPAEPRRISITSDGLTPVEYGGVEVRSLSKSYGSGARRVTPVAGLSATFAPGRFHVVTGPSGSGKTTLLQLLAGLELPTEGEVVVAGQHLSALDREERATVRARLIGVVGQQGSLIPFLTVRENLELAQQIRGRRWDANVLEAVGVADRSDQQAGRLSSGELVRVAIARAIAGRPAVLIADEPTSRLDQANALSIAALFRRLAGELGTTVICATHDPLVIEQADTELSLAAATIRQAPE